MKPQRPCNHGPMKIAPGDYNADMFISNATTITTQKEPDSWYQHLGATLLTTEDKLNLRLWTKLRENLDQYEVQWTSAKANKGFVIRHLKCGWVTYAKWSQKEESAVAHMHDGSMQKSDIPNAAIEAVRVIAEFVSHGASGNEH